MLSQILVNQENEENFRNNFSIQRKREMKFRLRMENWRDFASLTLKGGGRENSPRSSGSTKLQVLSMDLDHPHTFRTGRIVDFLVPEEGSKKLPVSSKLHI